MANKLNPEQLNKLNKSVELEMELIRHYRRGQAYFNCLMDISPDLAHEIIDTEHDPFYDDSKIPQFLEFIKGD